MDKTRVYVETTIPSFYHEARTTPDIVARRDWTRLWWDDATERHEGAASVAATEPVSFLVQRSEMAKRDARPYHGGTRAQESFFMSPLLQQFGLDVLCAEDRLALAQALWDSLHDTLDGEPIAPEVRAEMERRAALSDADPSRGIPWEAVRTTARARWRR